MELNEFIEKSLLEILEGVRSAADKDLAIAPARIEGKPVWNERLIEFDVQVSVDSSAAGGIKVMSLADIGGDVSKTQSHRVSFSVPAHMNVDKQVGNK